MRKFFVMIVAIAAMAIPGAFASTAHAGCIALAGGAAETTRPIIGQGWDGAGGMQCTTNNGNNYEIQYHFDGLIGSGVWRALPRTGMFPLNRDIGCSTCGPVANNFKFTEHYFQTCGSFFQDMSPIFNRVRTDVIVTNLSTGSVSHAVGATSGIAPSWCNGS